MVTRRPFPAFTAAYFHPTRVWIEVLDLETGGMRAVSEGPHDYASERYDAFGWSADGSRLLVYYKHPEEGHIITLRADGTGRQDILSDRVSAPGARGGGTLSFLTWSPDERMIVFNCYAGLCAVHTDGSGHRLLDPPGAGRYMADWQPR